MPGILHGVRRQRQNRPLPTLPHRFTRHWCHHSVAIPTPVVEAPTVEIAKLAEGDASAWEFSPTEVTNVPTTSLARPTRLSAHRPLTRGAVDAEAQLAVTEPPTTGAGGSAQRQWSQCSGRDSGSARVSAETESAPAAESVSETVAAVETVAAAVTEGRRDRDRLRGPRPWRRRILLRLISPSSILCRSSRRRSWARSSVGALERLRRVGTSPSSTESSTKARFAKRCVRRVTFTNACTASCMATTEAGSTCSSVACGRSARRVRCH